MPHNYEQLPQYVPAGEDNVLSSGAPATANEKKAALSPPEYTPVQQAASDVPAHLVAKGRPTCFGCIDIRTGVATLVSLSLSWHVLLSVLAALFLENFQAIANQLLQQGVPVEEVRQLRVVDLLVLMIALNGILCDAVGLYSVVKQKAALYRTYVYMMTFIGAVDIVTQLWLCATQRGCPSYFAIFIRVYFLHVYHKYIPVQRQEIAEQQQVEKSAC